MCANVHWEFETMIHTSNFSMSRHQNKITRESVKFELKSEVNYIPKLCPRYSGSVVVLGGF
jgi:hypothetical protein